MKIFPDHEGVAITLNKYETYLMFSLLEFIERESDRLLERTDAKDAISQEEKLLISNALESLRGHVDFEEFEPNYNGKELYNIIKDIQKSYNKSKVVDNI